MHIIRKQGLRRIALSWGRRENPPDDTRPAAAMQNDQQAQKFN
jgi:hypothetical protein